MIDGSKKGRISLEISYVLGMLAEKDKLIKILTDRIEELENEYYEYRELRKGYTVGQEEISNCGEPHAEGSWCGGGL
jgi:hypothetical protein